MAFRRSGARIPSGPPNFGIRISPNCCCPIPALSRQLGIGRALDFARAARPPAEPIVARFDLVEAILAGMNPVAGNWTVMRKAGRVRPLLTVAALTAIPATTLLLK